MDNIELSIIVPCYNEGKKLVGNIEKINKYIIKNIPELAYEIIIVNDGSTDNTLDVLSSAGKELLHTRVLSYEYNLGKGGAVKYGVERAIGKTVAFMDADLSTDLSAINKVLTINRNSESGKIIIGSRRHKESIIIEKQKILRKITGICCIVLTNIITRLWLLDTQCGFKVADIETAKKIVSKQTINDWAFDVEWLYIAKLNNVEIVEIPVIWENDRDSRVKAISSSVRFTRDLFNIVSNKKNYRFLNIP